MQTTSKLLSLTGLSALVGTICAFHFQKAMPANVYDNIGGGIYIQLNCSTVGSVSCTPATVPSNHTYYMYSNGSMTQLPEGTPLFRPE